MNEKRLGETWRKADAAALDARVIAISDWLNHTDNLIALFKDDEETAKQLRGVAGQVRMRCNDISSRADEVRAELDGSS
jgi:hypothetical protein